MESMKVVRSPGWDPGYHEELQNGLEVKIYIWEVIFWVPEKVQFFSVLYREGHWKVPEGSRGVRKSSEGSTTSQAVAWAVGAALALLR